MRLKFPRIPVIFILTGLLTGGLSAADPAASAPDPAALVQIAQQTRERLRTEPARWTIRCTVEAGNGALGLNANDALVPNLGEAFVINVVQDQGRRAVAISRERSGRAMAQVRLIEQAGVWFVEESGRWQKCRPYEASIDFPSAYYLHSLAEPMLLGNAAQLDGMIFQSRQGAVANYQIPIGRQERQLGEQLLAEFEKTKAEHTNWIFKPEYVSYMKAMRKLLDEGTPLRMDTATGMLVQTKTQDMTVTLSDFAWLKEAPADAFSGPKSGVTDNTAPWDHPENWIAFNHDPHSKHWWSIVDSDAYVVDTASGAFHRVPFRGARSMPLCFMSDRHKLLVGGDDVMAGSGLMLVDLQTGENTPVTDSRIFEGFYSSAALSPDGREVALLRVLSGEEGLDDAQLRILDLATGRITDLGKPHTWSWSLSWLPDGSGVVVCSLQLSEDKKRITNRTVCAVTRGGEVRNITAGDTPLVLTKARRILYQKNTSWLTCSLDGSDPKPFAARLPEVAQPGLSPDETHIAFMRMYGGTRPVLMVFTTGKADGRQVLKAPGYVAYPVW